MKHLTIALVLVAACSSESGPAPGELVAGVDGIGTVVVTSTGAAGISCIDGAGECRTPITVGEVLTVSAQAGVDYSFQRWETTGIEPTLDDTSLPQQVTVTAGDDGAAPAILLTAYFIPDQQAGCVPSGAAPSGPPTDITASPTAACARGRITLSASNVSADGNACVTIGGAELEISLSTPANVAVPATATAGTAKITVTTTGGTAMSAADFTVTAGGLPDIDDASPASAPAGTVVTLTGTGLAGATVTLAGPTSETPAVTASSATSLQFTMPSTVTAGTYLVTATVAGCGSSGSATTLTVP